MSGVVEKSDRVRIADDPGGKFVHRPVEVEAPGVPTDDGLEARILPRAYDSGASGAQRIVEIEDARI